MWKSFELPTIPDHNLKIMLTKWRNMEVACVFICGVGLNHSKAIMHYDTRECTPVYLYFVELMHIYHNCIIQAFISITVHFVRIIFYCVFLLNIFYWVAFLPIKYNRKLGEKKTRDNKRERLSSYFFDIEGLFLSHYFFDI